MNNGEPRGACALDIGQREQIIAGDDGALLHAFVCLACLWMEEGGYSFQMRKHVLATNGALDPHSARGALVSASLDICAMLELSPKGREALDNFRRN